MALTGSLTIVLAVKAPKPPQAPARTDKDTDATFARKLASHKGQLTKASKLAAPKPLVYEIVSSAGSILIRGPDKRQYELSPKTLTSYHTPWASIMGFADSAPIASAELVLDGGAVFATVKSTNLVRVEELLVLFSLLKSVG